MKRIIVLVVVSGCALKGSLMGSSSPPVGGGGGGGSTSQPTEQAQPTERPPAEEAPESPALREARRTYDLATHRGSDIIQHFEAAREGKVHSLLIGFENRDHFTVEHRLDMLKNDMGFMEDIAEACAAGAGEKDVCELAKNRDSYFAKVKALQFDGIVAEHLKAWSYGIEQMKSEGKISANSYNMVSDKKQLAGKVGKELVAIGKVLGKTDAEKGIDAALTKLNADLVAAIRAKAGTNAWAQHASDARHQDAAVTKAVRQMEGLSMVRVGATAPTWDVRYAGNRPIKRVRDAWALMKKPGESWCRLYSLQVIEEHQGGGRYGEPFVEFFGGAEWYASACK